MFNIFKHQGNAIILLWYFILSPSEWLRSVKQITAERGEHILMGLQTDRVTMEILWRFLKKTENMSTT